MRKVEAVTVIIPRVGVYIKKKKEKKRGKKNAIPTVAGGRLGLGLCCVTKNICQSDITCPVLPISS